LCPLSEFNVERQEVGTPPLSLFHWLYSRLPIIVTSFNCRTLCNCRAAISGRRCDNYMGITYGLRQLSIIWSPHTVRMYSPWKHANAQYISPSLSPSTYVDLSVAVRGQLASGYVRECMGKPNLSHSVYNCCNAASGHPATIIGSRLIIVMILCRLLEARASVLLFCFGGSSLHQ